MAESILTSIKSGLGLSEDYTVYDNEITMHINSVMADLNQMGVGPDAGFMIFGTDETWDDFFETPITDPPLAQDPRLNSVKSYMVLRVKLIFDPPDRGDLVTAYEKQIEKAEVRITMAQDEIKRPPTPLTVPAPEDIMGDGFSLDMGQL